jgi:rod shape-determining protein MreC
MHRIAAIKSLAQRFAYMGLVGGAFALMLLGRADTLMIERLRVQVTDAIAPILDAMSRPAATVVRAADEVRELLDIRGENARLREERERLLQWQTVARRLQADNAGLRSLLNYNPVENAGFVTARVIADTGGAFAHSVVLNAGTRDGVKKDQAVVNGNGLVGRVIAVGGRSARVLLLTDLNSHVPILIESTNTPAILAGDNSNRPRLVHLPQGAVVAPGDRIVTSGHGGILPPRLPIGVVVAVNDGAIVVEPFVDRSRLEFVRAVDFTPSLLPMPARTPAASEEGSSAKP